MLLHYKYPRYLEDGALAFSNSLPTIYSSITSPLGAVQHLCRQLGLPLACVRPIPVNTHFGKKISHIEIICENDHDQNNLVYQIYKKCTLKMYASQIEA